MEQLDKLLDHIAARVNVNLRKPFVDATPYVKRFIPKEKHSLYYAFYALTTKHPLHFRFMHSSLTGTYFLGKCKVDHSVLYKSDIRGDELKSAGSKVDVSGIKIRLNKDEKIDIKYSFLVKTLVHCSSHDPENLENFTVLNTVSLPYANIHGSRMEGCLLGPFATADLTVCRNSEIGAFSYVQTGELGHERIEPGRVWVKAEGVFEFDYVFPEGVLDSYIAMDEDYRLKGEFVDFFEQRKEDFVPIYSTVTPEPPVDVPDQAHVSPYAVVKGECEIGRNVLVVQRAYIENSSLGEGSNAQENCYIIDSVYEGRNVTAHGGRVIHVRMGENGFIGFNSYLKGSEANKIEIGPECIVMPHTIIDAAEPISIPGGSLVWGYIRNQEDIEKNTVVLAELAKLNGFSLGRMTFKGSGEAFVEGFKGRIKHILEENGAYCDGSESTMGHAQKTEGVSFNLLQPYSQGPFKGMYPNVCIDPLTPQGDGE